jgi:ABC-type lipoprotein export system ATPase subunit
MFLLNNIKHSYFEKTILNISHWESAQGSHCLILGPSGCGKTTLLHIMAGLLTPQQGSVVIAHQNLGQLNSSVLDRFRGQNIGIVFQKQHLIKALTVFDNLVLAQYLANVPQNKKRVAAVLAQLNLTAQQQAYPHTLSQGQAQRVALARAVINRPKILLCDEPTASLDDAHCQQVLDLLENQARECNATLIIATHDARVKQRLTSPQYPFIKGEVLQLNIINN